MINPLGLGGRPEKLSQIAFLKEDVPDLSEGMILEVFIWMGQIGKRTIQVFYIDDLGATWFADFRFV